MASDTAHDRMFQSTPARGGRHDSAACHATHRMTFQSTPARGGRRRRLDIAGIGGAVSIHARTRRATRAAARHVSARSRFNPRPHAAGDRRPRCRRARVHVSIHARTRRATRRPRRSSPRSYVFQSTPARGGRRRVSSIARLLLRRFNPRPHAAGDRRLRRRSVADALFQSTPARGGRPRTVERGHAGVDVSIHARTRRATQHHIRTAGSDTVSIHARTRRATPARHGGRKHDYVSIHARTRRATLAEALTVENRSAHFGSPSNALASSIWPALIDLMVSISPEASKLLIAANGLPYIFVAMVSRRRTPSPSTCLASCRR